MSLPIIATAAQQGRGAVVVAHWKLLKTLNIIVPVLNEARGIQAFLQPLQKHRQRGVRLILIDGGSSDTTVDLARPLCDVIERSDSGRAKQMNVGANKCDVDILLFLHADTLLPDNFHSLIAKEMQETSHVWGRFDVHLSGENTSLRIIEFFMNLRSRCTGIATGDQAIFVNAKIFHQLNGYDDIPLMEDIEFSKKLKRISPPICLKEKVTTSSRRWEAFGIWRTIFLMWRLRLAYFFGADPHRLSGRYEKK